MNTISFDAQIDSLRERLQKAVEVELTTIPPYLIAALSILKGKNVESLQIIRSVYMEEMLHLLLAANTLNAIGGQVCLGKDNIPHYPCRMEFKGKVFRDRVFDINLEAFSKSAIDTFKQIELPEGFLPQREKEDMAQEVVVEGYTLGDFYRGIQKDLTAMVAEFGAKRVFSGNPALQINEEYYWAGGGRPMVVTNLKTALKALEIIIDQGEGTPGHLGDGDHRYFDQPAEVAHYFRFNEIWWGQKYKMDDNPHRKPTGEKFKVDYNAVHPIKTNCTAQDFDGNPQLQILNRSFNEAYSLMLTQLQEGFRGNPKVLYTAIMNGMHKLSPIANQMMTTPLPGDAQGRTAAPTFEWAEPPLGL